MSKSSRYIQATLNEKYTSGGPMYGAEIGGSSKVSHTIDTVNGKTLCGIEVPKDRIGFQKGRATFFESIPVCRSCEKIKMSRRIEV